MKYCYDYPRPGLTVDALILKKEYNQTKILLVERKYDPYAGLWALPGGFIEENETAEDAVMREIQEETSLSGLTFHQLFTVSTPMRDPRGWTISVIYFGDQGDKELNPVAADDAKTIQWFDINQLPGLAFDHNEVITKALEMIFRDKQ